VDNKFEDKKQAALQATLELIAEQGFHATPMSQIAKRANIGVGTIYRYFNSKEDLINALYIESKARLSNYVLRNYSESKPVRECFNQLIHDTIYYFIDNSSHLSFIEQYSNSPLISTETRKEGLRIAGPTIGLFKRAMEQGLFKELPLQIIGALISGATISFAKLYLSGDVNPDENSLTASINAIWDMVKR